MVVEARVSAIASTLTINRGVNMNPELKEKREKELENIKSEASKLHAIKVHTWEDEVFDAINKVWENAVKLDAHGFTNFDSGYVVFALERFKKEFEYANERDRREYDK